MNNWHLTPAQNIGQPMHEQLRSARREGGLISAIAHFAWCGIIAIYLRLYHRLSIVGRAHLPRTGPFVLVCNHASHLDALVLASAVRWRLRSRVFPVAAGDAFFATRLTATVSALFFNALPMWRQRAGAHGLAELRNRLPQDQCIYIVFPEGTRTRTGSLNPFHAGVGMLVAGSDVPVIPCFISGSFRALPHNRRIPTPVKLRLNIGQPMVFGNLPNNRDGWERVAENARHHVVELNVNHSASGTSPRRREVSEILEQK